jgi:hypothetical protein
MERRTYVESPSLTKLPYWVIGLFGLSLGFVTLVSVFLAQSLVTGVMTGLGGVSGVVLTFYLVKPTLLDSR